MDIFAFTKFELTEIHPFIIQLHAFRAQTQSTSQRVRNCEKNFVHSDASFNWIVITAWLSNVRPALLAAGKKRCPDHAPEGMNKLSTTPKRIPSQTGKLFLILLLRKIVRPLPLFRFFFTVCEIPTNSFARANKKKNIWNKFWVMLPISSKCARFGFADRKNGFRYFPPGLLNRIAVFNVVGGIVGSDWVRLCVV